MTPLPGLHPARLARLMSAAVDECRLDLRGRTVVTEAATGAYVVTPVLAALAGAEVLAVTRSSRWGSVQEVRAATEDLATRVGVADRITVRSGKRREDFARADIVTNSGHLRPLDAETIGWMRPGSALPLMFEAWEIDAGRQDVDLAAARERGLEVAGTNERHPAVGVFDHLGTMAVKLMLEAGVAVRGSTVLVLCDNPFEPYLRAGLTANGATVMSFPSLPNPLPPEPPDVLLLSLRPEEKDVFDAEAAGRLGAAWPGTVLAQFFGDADRAALERAGVPCWPPQPPPRGHMGVLPSAIGPEPVVRLQAGGLKVGAVLLKPEAERSDDDREFLDVLR